MRPSTSLLSATYYQILGVPRSASKKEIKSKFYALSKLHHPDTHKSSSRTDAQKKNSDSEFVKISEAYSVLGNADARKKYDATLPADRSLDVNDPRRAGWSMMERERKRQREWREKVSRQDIWNMRTAQRARTYTAGHDAPGGTGPSGGASGTAGAHPGGIGTGGTTGIGGMAGNFRQPVWNTSHIHNSPLGKTKKRGSEQENKPFFETHLAGSFFFVTGTLSGVLVTANVLLPIFGGA